MSPIPPVTIRAPRCAEFNGSGGEKKNNNKKKSLERHVRTAEWSGTEQTPLCPRDSARRCVFTAVKCESEERERDGGFVIGEWRVKCGGEVTSLSILLFSPSALY